jgi:hypothetical protein
LANRLTAALCEYYPAMFDMFADVTGPTARAFLLAYPTLAATQNLDRDTLKTFLVEHHSFTKRRLVHILEATTRPAVPVPAEIVEVKQQTVKQLVEQLQLVQKAIDEYDARIQELTAEQPEVKRWRKLPGAGLIVGSSLYTLFGDDRRRFANEHEVQAYVGISPRTIQSGNYRAVCFRHGCNQDYRRVMMHWALSSIRKAEWAKRYYGRKRAQGMKHHHALRCLGCVLLRIGFAMWKKDTTYDEEVYLASMARHQIRNEPKVAKSG